MSLSCKVNHIVIAFWCKFQHKVKAHVEQYYNVLTLLICKMSFEMCYIPTKSLYDEREKEEIWLSPMTKAGPYNHRKIQKATWQHKNATKKLRLHIDCGPT